MLRRQVGIAQIEIGAAHVAHVAVVLLLGCGRLESLAPVGPYAPVAAQGEHGRELRCQLVAELPVMVQTESGG